MRRLSLLPLALVVSLVLAVTAAPQVQAASAGSAAGGRALTVMTRNVYVGGDITRPIAAALGKPGREALLALGHANHDLRSTVDRTRFAVRSKLLAEEMVRVRPELIGLQEVALWRRGPLQLDRAGVPNATTVDYDFLAMLLTQLRRSGAPYRVASVQQTTDVEAPAFRGDPTTGTATDARDVRLTVRDVVLVRSHSAVRVLDHGGGTYRDRISLDLGGLPLSIVRGYAWADVRSGSQRLRFVTTHLESQSSDLALAQASELLTVLRSAPARTILVCDCNSDPLRGTIRPNDRVPHSAAYRLLTGSGGFEDAWLQRRRPADGFTSGLSEHVDDPTADGFRHRIDLILSRSTDGSRVQVRRAHTTGDQDRDRDRVTGLWPSDHAGVVVRLRLRR